MRNMTRGEHLAHSPLSKAQKVVRGLWFGLTEKERWEVACRTVDHLKEHGDKWKLNEELESPVVEAHGAVLACWQHGLVVGACGLSCPTGSSLASCHGALSTMT